MRILVEVRSKTDLVEPIHSHGPTIKHYRHERDYTVECGAEQYCAKQCSAERGLTQRLGQRVSEKLSPVPRTLFSLLGLILLMFIFLNPGMAVAQSKGLGGKNESQSRQTQKAGSTNRGETDTTSIKEDLKSALAVLEGFNSSQGSSLGGGSRGHLEDLSDPAKDPGLTAHRGGDGALSDNELAADCMETIDQWGGREGRWCRQGKVMFFAPIDLDTEGFRVGYKKLTDAERRDRQQTLDRWQNERSAESTR